MAPVFPLNDVSLEGFSAPTPIPLQPGQEFAFALRIEGIPDRIRGRARAVNEVPNGEGSLIGCSFVVMDDTGAEDLKEWLTAHVISLASVRISAAEAEAIVQGAFADLNSPVRGNLFLGPARFPASA